MFSKLIEIELKLEEEEPEKGVNRTIRFYWFEATYHLSEPLSFEQVGMVKS